MRFFANVCAVVRLCARRWPPPPPRPLPPPPPFSGGKKLARSVSNSSAARQGKHAASRPLRAGLHLSETRFSDPKDIILISTSRKDRMFT